MTLSDLIQRIPNWQTKTPEQLLAALSDPSILVEDHQQYTFAEIARIAGDVGASALCDKLTELGKTWAVYQLGGLGLDLANEEIQQLLYYLESIGVPGMAAVAMSKRKQISPLEQAGLAATTQDIQSAVNSLLFDREWATIQNEVIAPAVASEDKQALATALRVAADRLEE